MNRLNCKLLIRIVMVLCSISMQGFAQRDVRTINEVWKFKKGDNVSFCNPEFNDTDWETVTIPHCWNAEDGYKTNNYYQGPGWYRKKLSYPVAKSGKHYFLKFEGALEMTDVYVNGKKVGNHKGGYTAFSFDVTSYLYPGDKNFLAVRVDNSKDYKNTIPPYSADFTMWGGLYRDVYLIETNDIHFKIDNYQSQGFFVSSPVVNEQSAEISIRGEITHNLKTNSKFKVTAVIDDANGKTVQTFAQQLKTDNRQTSIFRLGTTIMTPHLWSPKDPYLYHIKVRIEDVKSGRIFDETEGELGIRWFSADSKNGFILNGKPLKLLGVNRHQDFAGKGSALTDDMHRKDVELIKELGANFIRIAHYPQDPAFLEACDRAGILAWEEIPVVNYVPDNTEFAENVKINLKEMILQNYNHPSIVMWGYMNEVLLDEDLHIQDLKEKKKIQERTVELAKELEKITRETDSSRLTTIAFHNSDIYNKCGLGDITQVIGWNLYVGNAGSRFLEFGKKMDEDHLKYPGRPEFISEYGIGGDKRVHTLKPSGYDYSIEYQQLLHESILPQILSRKFIIGSTVWNLIDFGSAFRQESTPHLNNKGLVYSNRVRKDVFYYYKAMLNVDPVIHIASRDWNWRIGTQVSPGESFVNQPVKVYSNLSRVELFLNGKSLGIQQSSNRFTVFSVPFKNGENILIAKSAVADSTAIDAFTINFRVQPYNFKTAGKKIEIGINAGSNCFYTDSYSHFTYEPDQPYSRDGSWGFIDDTTSINTRSTVVDNKSRIEGTEQDPLFQTMRQGIKAYKFDVPDGSYELTLFFAAPVSKEDAIVNNVEGKTGNAFSQRIFDVLVNDGLKISHMDLSADYGSHTAVEKLFLIKAENNKGVLVDFKSYIGLPIISGLKLRRIS